MNTNQNTFEHNLQTLEKITINLGKDISLEQALKEYEQGIVLVKKCQKELQDVEKKILKLVENNNEPIIEEAKEYEFPTLF